MIDDTDAAALAEAADAAVNVLQLATALIACVGPARALSLADAIRDVVAAQDECDD